MATASRNLADMRCFETGLVEIAGSFVWNSTTISSVIGKGFSVAHTSTGLVTITLSDAYNDIVSVVCVEQSATGTDALLQIGEISQSGETIQIRRYDVSGAAVADAGGQTYNFQVWVKNSNATP